jgi:hypothetical protein
LLSESTPCGKSEHRVAQELHSDHQDLEAIEPIGRVLADVELTLTDPEKHPSKQAPPAQRCRRIRGLAWINGDEHSIQRGNRAKT